MSQPHLLSLEEEKYLYEVVNMDDVNNLLIDENNLLSTNEDLKDIFIPNSTSTTTQNVLSKEKYLGPYNFQVEVDNQNNSNNGYMYSDHLNKVYTRMTFPIQVGFKLNCFPPKLLYIRATPVYSLPQFAQECVYRCINHAYSDNEVEEYVRQHILRCSNSLAQYLGERSKNERLSVRIPLSKPQTGTDLVMEMFQFVCQNSCPTPGMNRRPVEVIFTLEDELCHIYGRQTFNVRVCCSPKRDMMKDVKEFNEMNSANRGKKRKVEKPDKTNPSHEDDEEYEMTLKIVGKHNVKHMLKYAQDLMAGEMVRHKNKQMEEHFKKCHEEISTIIRDQVE